ncbi:MAG: sel1 repeat family protein, partial [Neisseriaceae bacterium]|nr:sel1 repeat family protein [Neisseriaceae bacterium]
MKRKLLLLTAVFSFALTPLAMAESAENLLNQGFNAYDKGNYTQAAKLYEQACHGGNAGGCYNLGVLYGKGKGVKQDYAQAAKLYEQTCNGGIAQGCNNLGLLYKNGQGVKQNYVQAAKLYEKACNGGAASGCSNLGVLYADG